MGAPHKEIREAVHQARRILITSQLDPDGDSVGSQLALRRILLAELGAEAAGRIAIVNHVACPARYAFLPDAHLIQTPEALAETTFDLGFVLDGGADRTGSARPLFDACAVRVLVDHHKTTEDSHYTHALLDAAASSTAELIYRMLEHDGWAATLDRDLAALLYVGMVYDTGCFMYALTTPEAHRIAARLMETGIDHSLISERVLLESSLGAKKFLGLLLDAFQLTAGGKIAWCSVTPEMQAASGANDDDVRASINHLIFITGVQAALMFKARPHNKVKVSLRSRAGFDVALFARSLDPGGGGHARAAGCTMEGSLADVAERVVARLTSALTVS